MQNNSLDVELQRTLNELCTDLFASSALDDCSAILQSLALLADTFPQAQSLLGRILSRNQDNQDRARYTTTSKLFLLSTRFLCRKETALSTISMLSALANNNERNQRRIVQSVTGVKLDIDRSKYGRPRTSSLAAGNTLYALTVPTTVTSTYRKWRKRQNELQKCRLPSGVPPTQDGIPMPCYCDGCLGAEQFLSTWQQHFHDLSRWSRDSNDEISTSSPRPSLSTEEFFRVFLADYQLFVCTVEEAFENQKEIQASCADRANRQQSLVYYFVSPEECIAATPRTPLRFNPLHHLSAIAIASDIDINATKKLHSKMLQLDSVPNESPSPKLTEACTLGSEQIILFTSILDVEPCVVFSPESLESSEVLPSHPQLAASSNERLLAGFIRLEEQFGQSVQCDCLLTEVTDDESEIAESTRELLLRILSFCELGDQVPLSAFRRNFCCFAEVETFKEDAATPRQVEHMDSVPVNAMVVVTAKLREQVLQIDCSPVTAESSSLYSFSTRVMQQELVGASSTEDNGGLSLLCLSDEALENLVQRCRVCSCDNPGTHENEAVLYLLPVSPEEQEREPSPGTIDEADENMVPGSGILHNVATARLPLSGLASEAKRNLERLETFVSEEKYRRLTVEGLTSMMEKLARIVAACNERISHLSTARDRELVRAATEVHRAAAISRCRHCRDLLIQLGKKLALKVKPLDTSMPISPGKLERIAKLMRTAIRDVLDQSETFDPWETPDARVEKLQLDRRAWASGFPDAAYYQDTDTRQRENRKKQQQLSRKLPLQ